MKRVAPTVLCISYLDDRLLVADSWRVLHHAFEATVAFDSAAGPQLNLGKRSCAVAEASSKCNV